MRWLDRLRRIAGPHHNWPFTMLVIMPTDSTLMAMDPASAGPECRALVVTTLIFLWAAIG